MFFCFKFFDESFMNSNCIRDVRCYQYNTNDQINLLPTVCIENERAMKSSIHSINIAFLWLLMIYLHQAKYPRNYPNDHKNSPTYICRYC